MSEAGEKARLAKYIARVKAGKPLPKQISKESLGIVAEKVEEPKTKKGR